MTEEKFYLIDLERSVVNNRLAFWKGNRHGYVYTLKDAGKFSRDQANEIVKRDYHKQTIKVSAEWMEKVIDMYVR